MDLAEMIKEKAIKNCKGLATIFVISSIMIICVVASAISVKYLGKDNPIENELEDIVESEAEVLLNVPEGSLKPEADILFPRKEKE
jgi:hypothetical protein